MKYVLAVHSSRNLEMAGREADEDFNMEEEENIEKRLEDIILHQVRFQILCYQLRTIIYFFAGLILFSWYRQGIA